MFLGEIAQQHMKEIFLAYNASQDEFPTNTKVKGRLGPVDRFLSIYSLPTKKRQLFVKPKDLSSIPDSGVIQHSKTKRIYLVGSPRMDARHDVNKGDPYVAMCTVHEVGSTDFGFTGKAVIKRLSRSASTGYLEYTEDGNCYADLEFRSTISDVNTEKETISGFFCWHQSDVELEQWDVLELGGVDYRITDTYVEMGLRSCRVTNDENPFVNATLIKVRRTYNPSTYQYEDEEVEENFTGILRSDLDKAAWASGSKPRIQFNIPRIAIDSAPVIGDKIKYKGVTKIVRHVEHRAGDKQYIVMVE
jgi:hypothetical protein